MSAVRFSYEPISDKEGMHFRVRDEADNRIATCYSEENALHITEALNYYHGQQVLWSCGHTASGHCAECYQALAQKSHELVVQLSDAESRTRGGYAPNS